MAHTWWHGCGYVGEQDATVGPLNWPKYSKFIGGFKVRASLPEHVKRKLERRVLRRLQDMAEDVADAIGGDAHVPELVDGDYWFIGVGDRLEGNATIPEHAVGTDLIITEAFAEEHGMTEAQASALRTKIMIHVYKAYLDVHEVTGGEIYWYGSGGH